MTIHPSSRQITAYPSATRLAAFGRGQSLKSGASIIAVESSYKASAAAQQSHPSEKDNYDFIGIAG